MVPTHLSPGDNTVKSHNMNFKDRFNFENIVNVLATGTYGNSYLSCYVAYDAKSQGLAYDIREGKAKPENGVVCREDVWAYVLTNGGKIVFVFDDDGEEEEHEVDMEAWKKGFQKFIEDDATDYADLMNEDGDFYTAWNLIQFVIFGEIVF